MVLVYHPLPIIFHTLGDHFSTSSELDSRVIQVRPFPFHVLPKDTRCSSHVGPWRLKIFRHFDAIWCPRAPFRSIMSTWLGESAAEIVRIMLLTHVSTVSTIWDIWDCWFPDFMQFLADWTNLRSSKETQVSWSGHMKPICSTSFHA